MDSIEKNDIYFSTAGNDMSIEERLISMGKSYFGIVSISDEYIIELQKNDIIAFEFRFLCARGIRSRYSTLIIYGEFNVDLLRYYAYIPSVDINNFF